MTTEETLLLASADPGLADPARQVIAGALAGDPDWTSLVRLALEHRMTPALLDALGTVDQSLVPSDLLSALRQHCDGLRDRSLYLAAELHAILEALEQEAVVAIAFKGPLMAEQLFGDPGKRVPGDLDMLVRPDDISRVCQVLEARGYVDSTHHLGVAATLTPQQHRMYRRYQCEYLFARVSDGVVVEPHWAFAQRMLAIDLDYRAMFDRAQSVSLGGRRLRSLATEDLLLALCIHGVKHRWERLAWIRDVAALIARSSQLDLESAAARARLVGCARILLLGLALARRCAGARVPVAIARLIDEDRTLVALEEEVLRHLFDPVKTTVDTNTRVDRFRFRTRERWPDRMRYVLRTLLVPRREHLEVVALPSPLLWAYYPLGWAADYVARPVRRLARRAVRRRSLGKER